MKNRMLALAGVCAAGAALFLGAGLLAPAAASAKQADEVEGDSVDRDVDYCVIMGGKPIIVFNEDGWRAYVECVFADGSGWACGQLKGWDYDCIVWDSGGLPIPQPNQGADDDPGTSGAGVPFTSGFSIGGSTAGAGGGGAGTPGGTEAVAREVELPPTPMPQPTAGPGFDSGFGSPGSDVAAPATNSPTEDESAPEAEPTVIVDDEPTPEPVVADEVTGVQEPQGAAGQISDTSPASAEFAVNSSQLSGSDASAAGDATLDVGSTRFGGSTMALAAVALAGLAFGVVVFVRRRNTSA
jgi:hypothetical protein